MLDKLKRVAADGKGKDPAAVLREMGKMLGGQSRGGPSNRSSAYLKNLRSLVGNVKQGGGTGGGRAASKAGQPPQPAFTPPTPEGTVVRLDAGQLPAVKDVAGTSPTAGGVPGPGGRVLPGQVSDPNARKEVEQHYKDETARYLSHERVPAEYRDLIKDYFSY